MAKPHKLYAISILALVFISCNLFSLPPAPKVKDERIGLDVSQSTGRLTTEIYSFPPSTRKIYLEFYLDVAKNSQYLLEFRWYHEDTLMFSMTNFHGPGYAMATLERDPKVLEEFPVGEYRVEIWFVEELISSTAFTIRD